MSRKTPDSRWERQTPLLGKGGVAAPSTKWSRSFAGAAGVVRSTSDNRWLEPTTPSAPAKEASRHFFNGRSHPSLSKEGSFAPRNFHLILNSLSSGVLKLRLCVFLVPDRYSESEPLMS